MRVSFWAAPRGAATTWHTASARANVTLEGLTCTEMTLETFAAALFSLAESALNCRLCASTPLLVRCSRDPPCSDRKPPWFIEEAGDERTETRDGPNSGILILTFLIPSERVLFHPQCKPAREWGGLCKQQTGHLHGTCPQKQSGRISVRLQASSHFQQPPHRALLLLHWLQPFRAPRPPALLSLPSPAPSWHPIRDPP